MALSERLSDRRSNHHDDRGTVDLSLLAAQIEDLASNGIDGKPMDPEHARGLWSLLGFIRDSLETTGSVHLTSHKLSKGRIAP